MPGCGVCRYDTQVKIKLKGQKWGGWKNWLIVCSSSFLCRGALAYQATLASRIECRFISPGGK